MSAGNKAQKPNPIGTILLDVYGSVPVYYVGGSTFAIEVPGANEPMKLTKDAIDRLIKEKQIHITAPVVYAEIIAEIDPVTGATPTHNADGTKRSMASQALMMLENEGFLPPSSDSMRFQIDERLADDDTDQADDNYMKEPPPRRRPNSHLEQAPEQTVDLSRTTPSRPSENIGPRQNTQNNSNTIPTRDASNDLPTDEFGRKPVESSRVFEEEERQKAREEKKSAFTSWMQNKVNASNEDVDSNTDWGEKLSEESNKVNKPFVIIAIAVVVVLAALFFGTYLLLSGNGDSQSGQTQVPNTQTTQNSSQVTYGSGVAQTYTRTDFDPESTVQNYKDATQDKYDIAIGFFKTLKSYYLGGDETAINKLVAIDAIGEQLANAYVSQTQTKQGLNEDEATTLRTDYANNFVASEKQHMKNKDSDASIFCGRVRDVKVDGNNDTMIYVVMESIAGDHQRACFVLQSDAEQKSWALTRMENPSGYISMIIEGPYNNDYTYGVESGMAAENAS